MRKLPLQVCLALALSHGLAASSFDDHMTKGRAAIAGGDFSAAEREYRAALREVRRLPRRYAGVPGLRGLSDTAERQQDVPAAEQYLRDALAARRQAGIGPVAELPAW